jgi:hypothetical protein
MNDISPASAPVWHVIDANVSGKIVATFACEQDAIAWAKECGPGLVVEYDDGTFLE